MTKARGDATNSGRGRMALQARTALIVNGA
jgi:hypothetical protein